MQLISPSVPLEDVLKMFAAYVDTGNWPTYDDLYSAGFNRWGVHGGGTYRDTDFERFNALLKLRNYYVTTFGFAIPCKEVLEYLAANGPWVEIGAGSGYWSAAIRSVGGDSIATDKNAGRQPYGISGSFGVSRMDALAAIRAHPDRNVLSVWPCYDKPWAFEAAREVQTKFALVSEGKGGCVATDSLFDLLDEEFEEIESLPLPQFPGIHDGFECYERGRA